MTDPILNILVVDDEPAIRRFLRTSLGAYGHSVTEAAGGEDALRENDHTFQWLNALLKGGTPADVLPAPIRLFVMGFLLVLGLGLLCGCATPHSLGVDVRVQPTPGGPSIRIRSRFCSFAI